MPIYEYQCPKCGDRSEQLCKLAETGKDMVCPNCGNTGLRRLVSAFACPGVKGGGNSCGSCKGGNCSSCH
jgi:putative FmdB family regulatory protein